VLFCLTMFCHYFTSKFSATCQDPISLCMLKAHAGGLFALFCLTMFCHYFTSEFSVTCQDPISLCMLKAHAGGLFVLFCLTMFCHYFTSEFSVTCQDPISLCILKAHAGGHFGPKTRQSWRSTPRFRYFPYLWALPIVKREANSIMNLKICR
jgi:hypothetical protein